MSGSHSSDGIIFPPIDGLLEQTGTKYGLVIYAAKRARQINSYYAQVNEGILESVGPLVTTHAQEKALSVALREINEGLLVATPEDPDAVVDVAVLADLAGSTEAELSEAAELLGAPLADGGLDVDGSVEA